MVLVSSVEMSYSNWYVTLCCVWLLTFETLFAELVHSWWDVFCSSNPNGQIFWKLFLSVAPRIACEKSLAYIGEKNVHIFCKVTAHPPVSTWFWRVDKNGTTVSESPNRSYWTIFTVRTSWLTTHWMLASCFQYYNESHFELWKDQQKTL